MAGVHPDPGAAPDRRQFVQPGPDVGAIGAQVRNVGAPRGGQRPRDAGDLPGGAEPAGQVVQPAGQADRPVRERALDLAPRGGPLGGVERAGFRPATLCRIVPWEARTATFCAQRAGHRFAVGGQAEVARRGPARR